MHTWARLVNAATLLLPCLLLTSATSPSSLTRDEAQRVCEQVWQAFVKAHHAERLDELDRMVLRVDEHEMRLLRRDFGKQPADGRSLWISLHGGGNTSPQVNDQQWTNQLKLYELPEGIYIAPRAPTNTWNLWHRPEIDRLLDRLIESAIVAWDVNPDRVYLMGYSAGGDGVYQLAPRMADRLAAAAMMAGHPNDASPVSLRNLPFAIYMGGDDAAYGRNAAAKQWGEQLASLQQRDASGYQHKVQIYDGAGHWMHGRDAEAVQWMVPFRRDPWPKRVVWRQGSVPHVRFYWLCVNDEDAAPGNQLIANVDQQTIAIQSQHVHRVELVLHDKLVDLDEPVRVLFNDQLVFEGPVARSEQAVKRSLQTRADPTTLGTANLVVRRPEEGTARPTTEVPIGGLEPPT